MNVNTGVIKVTKNQTFIYQKTDCVSYRLKFYRNTKEKLCQSVTSHQLFPSVVDGLIRTNEIIS